MKHIKKMKIDIYKKNFEVIPSVQYDSNTRFLHIHLLNGSVPLNLSGCSVKISGTKQDGTAIFNNCTIINAKKGFVEVELTEQINAIPGTVKCELKIYSESGVLTTKHFDIEVTAPLTASKEIVSSNEFKALTDALKVVQGIDNKADKEKVEEKFGEVYEQLDNIENNHLNISVKDFICDDGEYVKGDGVHDDTTGIQKALNVIQNKGGKVYFPAGVYVIKEKLSMNTSTVGKRVILNGAGLGVTNLVIQNDVSGFELTGYLYEIKDLQISYGLSSPSNYYGLKLNGGGRRQLKNLQISGFKNALYQEGSFDMFNIDNCNFCNSGEDGFNLNVNNNGSCALLNVTNSLFNNNRGNGLYVVQTAGQIINTRFSNCEFISNLKNGIQMESKYGNPITGITLDSCDIEHIKSNYSAIEFQNVYKFTIRNCAFNVIDEQCNGIITLQNCKDGIIETPWISDSISTEKKIYLKSTCETIYLIGLRQSVNTRVGFYVDNGEIPISCINLDDIANEKAKTFMFLNKSNNYTGLEESNLKGMYSVLFNKGVQSEISIIHNSNLIGRTIKSIEILWYNNDNTVNNGNIVFTIYNNSLESNPTVYSTSTSPIGEYLTLKTTKIPIGNIKYDNCGFTPFIILRNGTESGDTFEGSVGIIGIIVKYV